MVFIRRLLMSFLASLCLGAGLVLADDARIDFALESPAVTSAGIYDRDDRLIRMLWTLEKTDAGKFTRTWDGNDDVGQVVAAGDFHYKIVANRTNYVNVGAIGNSGLPPNAAGHTPAHIAAVAVDGQGAVYTANGWDEAGADFKKWDADGKSIFDANYQIRNGTPNGVPYAITVDDRYIYCAVSGLGSEAQQIQRFRNNDGKEEKFTETGRGDGHIQVYDSTTDRIPEGTPADEVERMKLPLRGVAVSADTIFVADYLGDRVLTFDRATGKAKGSFGVRHPQAMTLSSNRFLIVAFDHRKIASFDLNGVFHKGDEPLPATRPAVGADNPANPIGEIEAISCGADGWMFIADSKNGVVLRVKRGFDPQAPGAEHGAARFGQPAAPGDRAPDHFFHLKGVVGGKDGSFVTIQDEPHGGARLAKWKAYNLAWEQFGCETVSLGNYAVDEPDDFYSMTFHRYRLGQHAGGKWDYMGCVAPFKAPRFYGGVHGVPRVLSLNGHKFYFLPSGDGVQVYRIEEKQLKLASLLGGRSPAPDGQSESKLLGQWSWHDASGAGEPKPNEIDWFKNAGEGQYSCLGMDVDSRGNIIFADGSTSIRDIPVGPADDRGNPTYNWKDVREIVAKDTSPLKFEPNMAQRADDGSVYAFGWSARWPQPANNGFWMGGTTLARFDKIRKLLWAVQLPHLCVGLDVIPSPGGGCIVGTGSGARLLHYTADGLLVGVMEPGQAMGKQSGSLDNHASVAVNRDPRDHQLDVFAEDDWALRIAWYHFDDTLQTILGDIKLR
jgi:hypothetical protein